MAEVEVRDLTKIFGRVTAVQGMSFTAPAGKVTGFLGPNGSGKTTTLRIVLGLVRADAGAALIGGVPYGRLARPRRTVGAMLEATGFHPGRRARDHLRVIADAAGIPGRRVDEVLAQVDLTSAARRRVREFSLGMRQRLGLATALLGDPQVLLLDEPANGLDPAGIAWLRGLLRSLADEGRTVIVASHVLSEVAQTVDRRGDRQRRAGALRRPAGRDRLDQQRPGIGVPQADRRRGLTCRGLLPRRATVLPLIRSEFRKLSTVRSPWLLLAAGPLLVVAGVTGLVQSGGDVHDPAVQSKALAHVALAALFTLIFGIFAVAGEYRHGTVTDTFLSTPSRGRVVAAKLVVYGSIGAVAGLVSAVVAVAVTAAWWAAKGGSFHLSAAGSWRTLAGGVAVNVAFAAIGVGVGALLRNLAVAIAAALAWIALVEGIAGQLVGAGLARWLPFSASQALGRVNLTGTARLLPQWGGALVLAGYAIAFAAAAMVTTLRRDVT